MIQDTAYITATLVTNPLGVESVEYGWQGGKVAIVGYRYLTTRQVKRGVFWIGPYRLRIIDRPLEISAVYVMRDGWYAKVYQIAYRFTRYARRFYGKCILTLAVWGLANYDSCRVPTWRDVHCLKWIAEHSKPTKEV